MGLFPVTHHLYRVVNNEASRRVSASVRGLRWRQGGAGKLFFVPGVTQPVSHGN